VGFSEMMIKTFINYLRPRTYRLGEYIKRPNRDLDCFFILFSGTCKIVTESIMDVELKD